MAISTRRLRPLVIDGVSWAWRMYDPWDGNELSVFRVDRRTTVRVRWQPNALARIERRGGAERGWFIVPPEIAGLEWGPGLAAAIARWAESDVEKQRPVAPAPPPIAPEWKECRAEGRYWFNPDGADSGEELVRAVIEERLQQPVISSFLPELEREIGPRVTEQFTRECLEALVARGALDESWLLPETRRVAVDALRIRDDAPSGFRSLRALWALAKAPRAVVEAERLAREFERAYRDTVSRDRLEPELAELSWVVVEHPYVAAIPVRHQAGGPMSHGPMHEWWSELVDLRTEANRALLQWPPADRPSLAYHPNASDQTPLIDLPYQHIEERRAWRALCDAGLRFRAGSSMDESGLHPRWHGRPVREAPSMVEATAAIARAGFALWTAMPWRMMLIATVRS
ncbi:MAG: hypothetical protein U0269_31345 [Polyangiales bacterium]